eukprot:2107122-Rhodomonas_salina.1
MVNVPGSLSSVIHHYRFSTAELHVDSVGGADLTFNGVATAATSTAGCRAGDGCLFLPEASSASSAANILDLSAMDALSVCFWAKTDNFQSGFYPFALDDDFDGIALVDWYNANYYAKLVKRFWYVGPSTPSIHHDWHHVCVSSDFKYSSGMPMFVDGKTVNLADNRANSLYSTSTLPDSSAVHVGIAKYGYDNAMFVDELIILNETIDEATANAIFSGLYDADPDTGSCSATDRDLCSSSATCDKENGTVTCTCWRGFADMDGDGSVCEDINECKIEEKTMLCDYQAECDNTNGSFACICPIGFVGDGTECFGDAWAVRSVFDIPEVSARRALSDDDIEQLKLGYARLVTGDGGVFGNASLVTGMPLALGAPAYGDLWDVKASEANGQITLMALFKNKTHAEDAVAALASVDSETYWVLLGSARNIADGPEVYRWVAQTTSTEQQINPTGMTVDRVYFEPSCLASGCWRVDVTYTVGLDNFNVFFLPKAVGSDALSYDFDYTTNDLVWPKSADDTFLPKNHPCTSADYDAGTTAGGDLPASITSCCLLEFLAMYRPVSTFPEALAAAAGGALMQKLTDICDAPGDRLRAVNRTEVPILAQKDQAIDISANVFPRPEAPSVPDVRTGVFVEGTFSGMNISYINYTGVVDAYVGIYTATLFLDEVELRNHAGQLKGTVGVEHTVDTFLGLVEFSMTGSVSLDPFVTQSNIHLEKTSFFSVSTHGVNAYTFLRYVNMRL